MLDIIVHEVRERERERERDGSDVATVVLKLAVSSHFPVAKIRTVCSTTFNSNGDHCGPEIGDELTLSTAKKIALFHLSSGVKGDQRNKTR